MLSGCARLGKGWPSSARAAALDSFWRSFIRLVCAHSGVGEAMRLCVRRRVEAATVDDSDALALIAMVLVYEAAYTAGVTRRRCRWVDALLPTGCASAAEADADAGGSHECSVRMTTQVFGLLGCAYVRAVAELFGRSVAPPAPSADGGNVGDDLGFSRAYVPPALARRLRWLLRRAQAVTAGDTVPPALARALAALPTALDHTACGLGGVHGGAGEAVEPLAEWVSSERRVLASDDLLGPQARLAAPRARAAVALHRRQRRRRLNRAAARSCRSGWTV